MAAGDEAQGILHGCGAPMKERINYTVDVASMGSQATTIIAKMKAAGVTTILCGCDPIMPIFLTQAADEQGYYPEWLDPFDWGDADERNFAQDQWAHDISTGLQYPERASMEAYKVFLAASGGKQPAEQYFSSAYYQLLAIFGALQGAGPGLTVTSFEKGWFSLPSVIPGDAIAGGWQFGPGSFDPIVGYRIVWWDPNATSAFDGKKGAYQWCDDAQPYTMTDPAGLGGPRVQLHCFGR